MKASSLWLSLFTWIFSLASWAKPLDVVFRLKEKIPMEELALTVLDPSSPRYNHFYSPEEIRDLTGPSDEEYLSYKEQLVKEGLKIVSESKTRLILTVRGESGDLEKMFSTHLENDFNSRPGEVAIRQLSRTVIPGRLGFIESVSGLDTIRRSRSHLIPVASSFKNSFGASSPDFVKAAFGITPIHNSGISGKGQHIAIATYDDFDLTDVQHFYPAIGMTAIPSVDKIIFNGTPLVNSESAAETETDCELSGMIAPNATIHVFDSASNSDPGEVQLFTTILDDDRAKIVNYSWGDCETNVSASHKADMDKIFARAVAQGVNLLVASGDSGALGCGGTSIVADWPAANPWVVGVGGTTLVVKNGKLAETGWSGSGGGVSALYTLPIWQSGFTSPYLKRSFPDVAFNADPSTGQNVWVHYPANTAQWIQIGGTSIAAPQWAGLLALLNEARGAKGSIGFINPIIYGMTASQHLLFFDDITQGDNNGFKAGPGWDAITGWGGPHGDLLLNFLRQ